MPWNVVRTRKSSSESQVMMMVERIAEFNYLIEIMSVRYLCPETLVETENLFDVNQLIWLVVTDFKWLTHF